MELDMKSHHADVENKHQRKVEQRMVGGGYLGI